MISYFGADNVLEMFSVPQDFFQFTSVQILMAPISIKHQNSKL